jgi:iron(III) transport system substrate-binding protein
VAQIHNIAESVFVRRAKLNFISKRFYLALLLITPSTLSPVLAELSQNSPAITDIALYRGTDRQQRLVDGAKKERELNFYSSLVVEDLTAIAAAFEKKYGIKVKYWRASSEKVVQRAVTEAQGGRFDFDVVETNGPEMESLHREKLLQEVKSPYLSDLLPQAMMPHKEWVGTRLNMFVQIYNTNLVKKEELPKTYQDLLNPKWKGRLGIEAEDFDWFAGVAQVLGEEKALKLFRDIAATNGISVRKGHTLLAGLVASGEVPFALTVYRHNAEKLKKKGAPVDWYVIPPAIIRANGVGVSKKPPHPNAAVLFYDFMIGDGQNVLFKGEYIPSSKKIDTGLSKLQLKFVDPGVILDESDKWQKLYAEIITKQSK